MIERNKFLHTVVSLLVNDIFPKYLHTDYEYGMIALHFISSLGRSPEIYPIRILLLTDERRVTRNLLAAKIKSVAPFVEWVDIQSLANYDNLDSSQYDYLLATKPLGNQEIDVISSFPTVKELLELQEKLQYVQENRTVVAREDLIQDVNYDLQAYLKASSQILNHFHLLPLANPESFEGTIRQIISQMSQVNDHSYLVEKLLSRFETSPMAIPNTGLVLLHTQSSKVTTSSFTIFELRQSVTALSMKRERERVSRCLLMLTAADASEEMRDLMTTISQSIIENHLYTEIYKTGNQTIIYQLLNTIFNEKIKKLEN